MNVERFAKSLYISRQDAGAPISNLQSPISNLQSPISNFQSPISNLQSPISNHHLHPIQPRIRTITGDELVVRALFFNALFGEEDDALGVADG